MSFLVTGLDGRFFNQCLTVFHKFLWSQPNICFCLLSKLYILCDVSMFLTIEKLEAVLEKKCLEYEADALKPIIELIDSMKILLKFLSNQ